MQGEISKRSRKLAKTFKNKRFGKAERIKINNKLYEGDLVTNYLAGAGSICSDLLLEHRENPFNSVDEIIGELQKFALESLNDFYSNYSLPENRFRKITIEDILEGKYKMLF